MAIRNTEDEREEIKQSVHEAMLALWHLALQAS